MMGIHTTYNLIIYSDNSPGMLHRITVLFTRRKLNIESLTVSETEANGISRFTLVVFCDLDTVNIVSRQIRRLEDIHEVFVSTEEQFIARELAMFKIQKTNTSGEDLAAQHGCKFLEETNDSYILEKTGSDLEINQTRQELSKYTISEFVRSGRVGLRRDGLTISQAIEDMAREPEPNAEVWI